MRLGADGWSWEDVLPVFRRMEDFDGGASELHGTGGPLRIMSRYALAPIHEAIMAAAQEVGIAHNPDYNSGVLDGVAQMQLTIRDGRRDSAAAAYLRPVIGAANLRVLTGAHAHRLLLDGDALRRGGVRPRRRLHRCAPAPRWWSARARSSRRRSCCARGIGPAGELRALNIEVAADLPGVGRNLHDHLLSPSIWAAETEIVPLRARPVADPDATCGGAAGPDLPGPDTQPIHFSVPLYEPWMEGPPNAFTLLGGMVRPQSRGSIRLSGPSRGRPAAASIPRSSSAEADLVRARQASLAQVRRDGRGAGAAGVGRARALSRARGGEPAQCATTSAARRSATTTRSAPAGWASTPRPWSTRACACTASRGCGWPTRR